MVFVLNCTQSYNKTLYIICIILAVLVLITIFNLNHWFLSSNSTSWTLIDVTTNFSGNSIYHHDGIAYDYYSKDDFQQFKPGDQWKIWPLPDEINHRENNSFIAHIETSPFVTSKLLLVDVIYIMTNSRLTERHNNLRKVFHRQGISMESVEWRMKWNQTTCNSNSGHSYVYKQLNLKDKPLDKRQQQRCAITMEHVDVWYEIAERQIQLALILEDDAIFVPFFKEKLARMIYASIRNGILRINGTCAEVKEKRMENDERIDQNPMIAIGTCFNFHDKYFQQNLPHPPPLLSTHKMEASRCTHAYLLTSCSSKALIKQIQARKNDFYASDFMQNHLFRLSPTLQSFWMDPPLAYQGNQVIDVDKIKTFKTQTYK